MTPEQILNNLRKYLGQQEILIPAHVDPKYDNAIAINNMLSYKKKINIGISCNTYNMRTTIVLHHDHNVTLNGQFVWNDQQGPAIQYTIEKKNISETIVDWLKEKINETN